MFVVVGGGGGGIVVVVVVQQKAGRNLFHFLSKTLEKKKRLRR